MLAQVKSASFREFAETSPIQTKNKKEEKILYFLYTKFDRIIEQRTFSIHS